MATATTTKPIDPGTLSATLGGVSVDLQGDGNSTMEKTVRADVPQADLDAAIAAHTHTPPRYITKDEFLARFLDDETVEIFHSEDPNVVKAYNALMAHPRDEVNLEADRTKNYVNYLESTAVRRDGVTKILPVNGAARVLA